MFYSLGFILIASADCVSEYAESRPIKKDSFSFLPIRRVKFRVMELRAPGSARFGVEGLGVSGFRVRGMGSSTPNPKPRT